MADDFQPLIGTPLLRALTDDSLGNLCAGPAGGAALVEIARARGRDELTLRIDERSTSALARCVHLAGLKSLSLACSTLNGSGLASLLRSPHLTSLEKLDLAFTRVGNTGARALARWRGLVRLRYLDLIGTELKVRGAVELAGSKYAGGLRWLRLSQNNIGDEGAAPLDGEAWIALDTLANSVRVAKEREAEVVAGRAGELRGPDAWKRARACLDRPVLSPFNTDRAAFAHPYLAGVRFPEWKEYDMRPELNDWEYLSSNAWLVVWRVAERLVEERAFRALTLAAPFMVGCGIDDDEDGFREGILRLLNWPAGA